MRTVGYDPVLLALDIEFPNGDVYRYFDVPPSAHAGLLAADSPGRYFHNHIRSHGYRSERMEEPASQPAAERRTEVFDEGQSPVVPETQSVEKTAQLEAMVAELNRKLKELEAAQRTKDQTKELNTAAQLKERAKERDEVRRLNEKVKQLEGARRAAAKGAEPNATLGMAELIDKAFILGHDGQYLGLISANAYEAKSIVNEYGQHGSKYAANSIFNEYGNYGGEYALQSPWNSYSVNPPKVFLGERFVGYLTKNPQKTPRIDPDGLVGFLKSKE